MKNKNRIDTLLETFSRKKDNNIPNNYNNQQPNNPLHNSNPDNFIRPNNQNNNSNVPNNYNKNNLIRPNHNNNLTTPNSNTFQQNQQYSNQNIPQQNPQYQNQNIPQQNPQYQNQNIPQQNQQYQNQNFNRNQVLNTYNSNKEMKISNTKINSLMPKTIAYEIKSEKWRSIVFIFIGLFLSFLFSIFLAGYYIGIQYAAVNNIEFKNLKFWGMELGKIPLPFISITFILLGLFMIIFGIINIVQIKREANHYIYNVDKGQEIIPNFIIENYKKMIKRSIMVTWFSFTSYVLAGIVLGFLYAFQQYVGQVFSLGFWSLGRVKNLNTEIYINISFLISVFFMQLFSILLTKKRKSNIIGYYGKSVISPEEENLIRKKTNRLCLIILIVLIVLITLLIIIPWWFGRRKKEGKSLKFWRRG